MMAIKKISKFAIITTLFIVPFHGISEVNDGDSESYTDLYLKNAETRQAMLVSYRNYLAAAYKDENCDILMQLVAGIENGSIFPEITTMNNMIEIFGEDEIKKLSESLFYLRIQKGKGRRSYQEIGGGFIPKETNEWFLIFSIKNDEIQSFNIHFGLERTLVQISRMYELSEK